MQQKKEIKLAYNSAYINQNLLDELDYVIGGYGKANQEFIFSLNNFVETFVLNEHFMFSKREWEHRFLTSKAIFPHGRPITNILFEKGNSYLIIDYPHYINSTVLYVKSILDESEKKLRQKWFDDFQLNSSVEIKKKYFESSGFKEFSSKYSYLASEFAKDNSPHEKFIIIEKTTTPKKILEGLYSSLSSSNYQVSLPFSAFKEELNFNTRLGVSNKSYKVLSDLHNKKIDELSEYVGYRKIPIPPLVPILLSQCNSIDDIPDKLKQLRLDFTNLRNSFANLEKQIDNSETIMEQMDAVNKLKEFWETFSKKYDNRSNRLLYHFWDFKKEMDVSESIEGVLDSKSFDNFFTNLNITTIIGKTSSKIYSLYKDRKILNRFKGLTNLWELFQKSPTLENQVKDIERIFKIKINPEELSRIANQIKN